MFRKNQAGLGDITNPQGDRYNMPLIQLALILLEIHHQLIDVLLFQPFPNELIRLNQNLIKKNFLELFLDYF